MSKNYTSLWQLSSVIAKWKTSSREEQEEVLCFMEKPQVMGYWSYTTTMHDLAKVASYEDCYRLFSKYAKNKVAQSHNENIVSLAKTMYDLSTDKESFKNDLKGFTERMQTVYLLIPDTTIEEEVLGLRGLATRKYPPKGLFEHKYCPRLEAVEKLPTVMRLKTFEALLSNKFAPYNIFEKIDDAEEFKRLLFGAVLRHRERCEKVWEKYQEVVKKGEESTVKVDIFCPSCGDYSVTILSKHIRTETGLRSTRIGVNILSRNYCSMCNFWSRDQGIKFTFSLIDGDNNG